MLVDVQAVVEFHSLGTFGREGGFAKIVRFSNGGANKTIINHVAKRSGYFKEFNKN